MTEAADWSAKTLPVDEDVPWELDHILTPEEEQEVEDWLNEPVEKYTKE